MKRLLLLALWVWTACFPVGSHDYLFKHIEVQDGLSNNQVNAIYKDSRGFMWFGTASGLNRYDGYDIRVYRSRQGDRKSLPDSYVEDIQEDAAGNLWIRTGGGYAVYDPASDSFDRDMERRMGNIGITGAPSLVYVDKEKTFWISAYGGGVYRYKEGQGRAVPVEGMGGLTAGTEVSDMKECREGILAVLNNGMLACIDKEKRRVGWTNPGIAEDCRGVRNAHFDLYADRDGRVWVSSMEGMWIYDLSRKVWARRTPRTDSYNAVRAVAQDKYGCIWVGRDHDGIELTEPGGRKIHLASDPDNGRTLSNNTITALYEDEVGTMWVGTYKKGVSFYNESIFKFGFAGIGDINCVEDGGGGIVWLGTNDKGLVRWNSVTGERTFFSHTTSPRSVSSDVIVCLLRGSDGKLWVGTFFGGLDCYDGTGFASYRKGDGNSLVSDNVWALAEDADKNIWIGTLGGGLQRLDVRTGTFTTYSTGNSALVSDYISSLCVSHDGNLVIGTSSGMAFMDLRTGEITKFAGTKPGKAKPSEKSAKERGDDSGFAPHDFSGKSVAVGQGGGELVSGLALRDLSSQNINQVYEDSRGLLWIATREGLDVYDKERDELYEVPVGSTLYGLPVSGVTEDENKSIWVSTGGELINVAAAGRGKEGRPVFRLHTYNDKDGLQSCGFNLRSLERLHTGEIVVGGLYGLNRFRPSDRKYNRTPPKVMFTGFRLFNEDVEVGRKYAGRVILKKSLNAVGEVVLAYKQNVFTVLFASDNYVLPEKTRYSYKLEGFDGGWLTSLSDMHRVTYTNLDPDTYTLRVKATNSDGYGGGEASLKIVILPPFWMTPWAYFVYALLIAGTVCFSIRAVQHRERNKFRMRRIEEDAKKKEELNQMKFRFFTNVSHDLRTPLTLIMSPMEIMMKEVADEKLRDKLRLMYRNAQRLLNLVNQLLDFRKSEMVGLHLALSEGDIVAYVRGICNSFLMLSEKKNVRLTFSSAMQVLEMSFDEDKIGKVVMNLLSNAFKFTPDGGRVGVALEMSDEVPAKLLIKVSDTGAGVKDGDKERIFERFYQADREKPEMRTAGSGIGLSLVRDFVTLHEGTVRVVDNEGGGSVFLVELPVKHVHVDSPVPAPLPENPEGRGGLLSGMEEEPPADDLPDGAGTDGADEKERPLALIVDDNEDLIAFIKDSLGLYFRIRSASDGQEAWRKIQEQRPDIVVSDVMMPGMDGNELCRLIKADKRTGDIPVMLLTARQTVEDKVEGLTLGADDYVTKPFNVEILILRMRKLIDLSRKRKAKALIDPEPSEIAITSLDEKLVEKAIKYVEANIARCDLSVEELSRELGMSRVHLYKKLLQITGKTPIEFIRVIRLKRAAQMLRESQLNVSEIAYRLGFNNPKYFSKYFKDEFGVLPSVYKEREGK